MMRPRSLHRSSAPQPFMESPKIGRALSITCTRGKGIKNTTISARVPRRGSLSARPQYSVGDREPKKTSPTRSTGFCTSKPEAWNVHANSEFRIRISHERVRSQARTNVCVRIINCSDRSQGGRCKVAVNILEAAERRAHSEKVQVTIGFRVLSKMSQSSRMDKRLLAKLLVEGEFGNAENLKDYKTTEH